MKVEQLEAQKKTMFPFLDTDATVDACAAEDRVGGVDENSNDVTALQTLCKTVQVGQGHVPGGRPCLVVLSPDFSAYTALIGINPVEVSAAPSFPIANLCVSIAVES